MRQNSRRDKIMFGSISFYFMRRVSVHDFISGVPLGTAKDGWICLPRFGLHVIRPRLDARHVAMRVLRVGRGYMRMAHLRTRVRMVRVMGGYVLDRRKGRLQLVVPDHLLSPVLPWRHLRDRLLRAVAFDRSLDLFLISGSEGSRRVPSIVQREREKKAGGKIYRFTAPLDFRPVLMNDICIEHD